MYKKIFYKEYLCNDKKLKKPIYVHLGDKEKFEGDGFESSEYAKISKNKKVWIYYLLAFVFLLIEAKSIHILQ